MLELSKIEKTVKGSFLNIENAIISSKKDLKDFKVTQAEEIKNLIIEDEGNVDLGLKLEKFQEELKEKEDKHKAIISSILVKEIDLLKVNVLSKVQEEQDEEEIEEEYFDLEEFDSNYLSQKELETEFKEVTNKFFETNEKEETFKTEDLDQWIKDIKKLI